MKPSLREDVTSVAAITTGAVISSVLTAALLLREPAPHATLRMDVRAPELHVMHVPLVRLAGPEGAHSHWFPGPRLYEHDLQHYGIIEEGRSEPSRPQSRVRGR